MTLDALAANLTSPVILFFFLGLAATLIRSDLSFPEVFTKAIAVYLLVAIGFKGGAQLAASGLSPAIGAAIASGVALGIVTPVIAFALLRRFSPLNGLDTATVAAHYGSPAW